MCDFGFAIYCKNMTDLDVASQSQDLHGSTSRTKATRGLDMYLQSSFIFRDACPLANNRRPSMEVNTWERVFNTRSNANDIFVVEQAFSNRRLCLRRQKGVDYLPKTWSNYVTRWLGKHAKTRVRLEYSWRVIAKSYRWWGRTQQNMTMSYEYNRAEYVSHVRELCRHWFLILHPSHKNMCTFHFIHPIKLCAFPFMNNGVPLSIKTALTTIFLLSYFTNFMLIYVSYHMPIFF